MLPQGDIHLLQETWLTSAVPKIERQGYVGYFAGRAPTEQGNGEGVGGVGILLKTSLASQAYKVNRHPELKGHMISVDMKTGRNDLRLVSVYVPQDGSKGHLALLVRQEIAAHLRECVNEAVAHNMFLVVGGDWNGLFRSIQADIPELRCAWADVFQRDHVATHRRGRNMIDRVFVAENTEGRIENIRHLTEVADHRVVSLTTNLEMWRLYRSGKTLEKINYPDEDDLFDVEACANIHTFTTTSEEKIRGVTSFVGLASMLRETAKEVFGTKQSRVRDQSFEPRFLKVLRESARRSGDQEEWETYWEAKEERETERRKEFLKKLAKPTARRRHLHRTILRALRAPSDA